MKYEIDDVVLVERKTGPCWARVLAFYNGRYVLVTSTWNDEDDFFTATEDQMRVEL